MKVILPILITILLASNALTAQTTLSLTSRGDLASTLGFSNPGGFSSENNKTIGARASFGFEMVRHTSENQALLVGLEYAISGFDYSKDLIFASDVDTTNWTFRSSSKLTGAYRYDFISFPVGYRWYRADEKWRFFAQGSLIPMAYLRTITSFKIKGKEAQGRTTESYRNEDFQTFHLAASAAFGVERTFLKDWSIGLQPTFRIHVTSVTTTEFKERPWTAGLQLNIGKQLTRF